VSPARQRLEPRDLPRLEVDERLVEHLQLVFVERSTKLGLDRKPPPRLRCLLRFIDLRLARNLGLLDGELGVAKQLLRVLAGRHQRDSDRAFHLDLELRQLERGGHHLLDALGGLERVSDPAPKRNEDAELVAAGPREHVAGAKRQDQPAGEGDQKLVSGETAHRFVDSAEAEHVDDQHRMFEVASDVRAGCLDGLGESEPVGKAGQAVAKHFCAQRPLGLHFHGPVDDAQQASFRPVVSGKWRQLQAKELRRNPFPLLEVEFAEGICPIEEALYRLADRAGLEAIGLVPIGRRARRLLDGVDEALVVGGDVKRAGWHSFDDRGGDRQGAKQAEVVHRLKVGSCIQSVRPPESLDSGRTGRCSLHSIAYEAEGLIPRIFFRLDDMLTEVVITRRQLAHANRLSRGKPIGGIRPAAPRAARHDDKSLSVRTRPLSPPSGQLSPSASGKATASLRPPSR